MTDECRGELELRIVRHINEKTWRRIQDLHVAVSSERVLVTGCTGWHYVKQLAIQAALETVEPDSVPLEVDIRVGRFRIANEDRNDHHGEPLAADGRDCGRSA